MKVLFCASEALPFAATGGLAEVAGSLPQALRKRLIGCRVAMPLYEEIPAELRENMHFITSLSVPVAWRRQYCGVFEAKVGGVIYYLLDNQYYFKRKGLYGHYDDAERFAFFSRAILEMLQYIDFKPEIIHCNDWQTGLLPVYYHLFYANNPWYAGIKTLYTIHNIQYQGKYGYEILGDVFGIPQGDENLLEYDGCINIMKGGIECAHRVSTVSPTYAKEILDPWYACGLHPILKERSWKLCGILNGIDTDSYDPSTDPQVVSAYKADKLQGKAVCKAALQEEMGLPVRPEVPVLALVSRLVSHKGLDLVQEALGNLLAENDMQVVVLGSGDYAYESFFKELQEKYPDKVSVRIGFIPALSRRIYAGADLFLMPSKSEPCGLSQMIALRYGTIPIVRETGGLKDSVTDCSAGEGNGFTFATYNSSDMVDAIRRALYLYTQKTDWAALVRYAMNCDNSWGRSANEYIRLYKSLLKENV